MIALSKNEQIALTAWEETDEDYDIMSFAKIQKRSGLDGSLVRRTVRAMARKGFARFEKACWTDDGEFLGAGYGLTREGRALLSHKPSSLPTTTGKEAIA